MARKVNLERRESWRQRIERQRQSGQTVAEFCRREGVPQAKAPSKAPFVQLPLSSTRTSPWIELVLVEGTIIRIPQQNLPALQTVLRAVDSTSRWPVTKGAHDA